MLDWLVVLVPALPVIAALLSGIAIALRWIEGERSESATLGLALGASALSAAALCAVAAARWLGILPAQVLAGRWIESGRFRVLLSFTLDGLTLGFAALIATLGLLVLRFSWRYMHREAGFHRFYLILGLFIGAMQLLALGGNGAITFLGWELAGVCSYLLIAYAHDRPMAADNATYVFVTNRVGDAAFVLALILSFRWAGDLEWPVLLRAIPRLDPVYPMTLSLCFAVAAMVKSAQIPFTPWITKALEGPTPSSALFYGGLLVHAGIFLILRLQPLIESAPVIMAGLGAVGAVTALYGYFCGLTQYDVKSSLIFATISQIGLMFLACGLGWWTLATTHLFCHAIFRAYQFLTAPSLMHRTLGQPARLVAPWLGNRTTLYVASLQRLWIEPMIAKWSVRPVHRLADDLSRFERSIVETTLGLPAPAMSALSSLAAWEERRLAADTGSGPDVREVSGLLGYLAHKLAAALHWFEEKLVLQGVGNDLWSAGRRFGYSLATCEMLLRQPRYLLLVVVITLLCSS